MTRKLKSFFSQEASTSSHYPTAPSTSTPLLPQLYGSNTTSDLLYTTDVPTPKATDIQTPPPPAFLGLSDRASSPSSDSDLPSLNSTTPSYDVLTTGGFESSHGSDSSELDDGADGRTSWVMAAFLLINAALGAGLLNYPVAYDRLGGIGFATVIQIFAVVLMATTMLVLVYCARLHNESSYHGVLKIMCGRTVMQLAAGSIAITCFGICVTFLIIIGDQFDRIFATYIGSDFCTRWYANRIFTMSATAIATIWPMCYFRRLDFLRHVNLLGVFASFYVIFLNVYTYYQVKNKEPFAPPYRTTPDSALEFIAALPVVFFAYQTHEIVIPVHVSMRDKSLGAFSKATGLSLAILLILYCLGGTYGYLTFGSKVAPDIMLMYDANDPIVVAGIIALVVKMVTTYPPVVFCGRDTIVRLLVSRKRKALDYQPIETSESSAGSSVAFSTRKYHIWITSAWNVVVLALAIITPNITVAIGFLGSLASCNVFIFPGLALIALAQRMRKLRISYQEVDDQQQPTTSQQHDQEGEVSERTHLTTGSSSTTRKPRRPHPLSLSRKWIQHFLLAYGAFIIAMGVIMFIIILIQVYHDFQKPIPHGAVCDASSSTPIEATVAPTH